MPKRSYSVIVGNVGTVYAGRLLFEARATFAAYVKQSAGGYGRAAGEPVTLTRGDGSTVKEYAPPRGKLPTVTELAALVRAIKATIADDYRADPEDTVPGILLTVGWNGEDGHHGGILVRAGEWSYQTGDNSYMGGAYGYPHWAIVSVHRRSSSLSLARDIRRQLDELSGG